MEELCKKDLNELDYYNGVVSHSEPNILECEVKWALRSTAVNKASGCDEIPAELFKSLKMMPSRFCIHYVSKSGRPSSGHRIGKSQSSSQFSRIVQTKECSNHQTIALISQASKVMLKILHSRLQHYVNQEPPDVQAGFRKEEELESKLPTFTGL